MQTTPVGAGANGNALAIFPVQERTANVGNHRVAAAAGTGIVRTMFSVPKDFGSLVSLKILYFIAAGAIGAGKNVEFFGDYGTVGEDIAFHSESDTTQVLDWSAAVANQLREEDISGVFSAIEAEDECAFAWDNNTVGGTVYFSTVIMEYVPA
jgi:hypothetical protein